MTNEGPLGYSYQEKSLYRGMTVKKYENGGLLYEVEGVRDNKGNGSTFGMVVERNGDVEIILTEVNSQEPGVKITFIHGEDSLTPNMAEALVRIPRVLFEKGGSYLDDEPQVAVFSRQEDLSITVSKDNGTFIRGLNGDKEGDAVMSLILNQDWDVIISLFQAETPDLTQRWLDVTFTTGFGGGSRTPAVPSEFSKIITNIARSIKG